LSRTIDILSETRGGGFGRRGGDLFRTHLVVGALRHLRKHKYEVPFAWAFTVTDPALRNINTKKRAWQEFFDEQAFQGSREEGTGGTLQNAP